jgi:DNA replication protein DnaC
VLDNIVKKNEWKTWSFVETVPVALENGNLDENIKTFKYDMRKCRKNITYYSKYEFPVFSVMDIPRTFSGTLQCGLFYVNTTNIYPFRGCGWYSQPIVEYGLSLNLIRIEDIQMEFLPSKKLPAEHFQKSIDILMQAFAVEPNLQKLSINSLIGLFGKTKRSSSLTKFTLCPHEASQWWGDKDIKSEVFIKNVKLDNNEILYNGIFTEQVDVEGMKYCLYKQVLEMEALELHKLESVIKRNGGIILDRNTDAIRYAKSKEIEIVEYWDDEKTVLKYQKELAKPLTCQMLPRLCRGHEIDLSVFNLKWNTQYDYEDAEEEASRIVDNNTSIHIDGRAGTGKTYLINRVIDELKSRGKTYMCFSPTNKGARLIGGNTIHSIYFKFKSNKKALFAKIEKVDYIFIDEVSMMVKEFYQLFILIKRSFPKINFIIAGDFGQLPPVNDDWTGDYENSPAMNGLCDGNRIKLMKCRRADRELFELCQSVENIDTSRFTPKKETYLNLAYTHETRIKINKKCMNRFIKETNHTGIFIPKDQKNPKTQDITLTKGMPIIAHTTNKKLNILNSQQFIITDVSNEYFTIEIDKISTKLKINKFNHLFYLGFCITIHASQGETFKGVYTIHDWKFNRFCSKAKYVAMSRGTDINNIQIA